jgi:LacI family transcriptional regulator
MIAMGAFDEQVACGVIQQMVNEGLDFDAVFAGDDEAAMGVIECLDQAGVRIPDQVAVVGFDDVDFVRHLSPALTTVHSPILDAGRIAGQILIDLIRTGQTVQETILPVELAIRKSCGC